MLVGPRDDEESPASAILDGGDAVPVDDGAPAGPDAGEEAAFLAEQRAAAIPESRNATDATSGRTAEGDLPPLEDLVTRIPAPVRQLADELFRAKFYTVKRVPDSALK